MENSHRMGSGSSYEFQNGVITPINGLEGMGIGVIILFKNWYGSILHNFQFFVGEKRCECFYSSALFRRTFVKQKHLAAAAVSTSPAQKTSGVFEGF